MTNKRFTSKVIPRDNNHRVVNIFVDPLMDPVCEIPIPKTISDESAIEFAKKTYLDYSYNKKLEFD